ncbi:dna repair helicase rad25, partial [Vairimorpha apis BRL 01]
ITAYSLYAAVSVGLSTDDILYTLNLFSKNLMPRSVKNFIVECTLSYGKVKNVIRYGKYFVEGCENVVEKVFSDKIVRENVVVVNREVELDNREVELDNRDLGLVSGNLEFKRDLGLVNGSGNLEFVDGNNIRLLEDSNKIDKYIKNNKYTNINLNGNRNNINLDGKLIDNNIIQNNTLENNTLENSLLNNTLENQTKINSLEVLNVETVKKRCIEIDFPLIEEYEFKNDTTLQSLDIDLKPSTLIRIISRNMFK